MATNTLFRKGIPHILAIIVFLIANAFYFSAQLEGKVENSNDILAARANYQEIMKVEEERGNRPLWTNSLFGGMPTYQIDSGQPKNLTKYAYDSSRLFIGRPIGMFLSAMLIFYIMLVLLGVNPWLSIVGALAFGLTTNNYVLYGAGHITKIYSVIHLGLVTAGLLLTMRKKKYLLGAVIFALGLALNLLANHVQMTYYFFLTLLLYGIIELVYHIRSGKVNEFGKAAGFLVVAGLIGIGSSTGKLWTTYEYGEDTMRGEPILTSTSTGVPNSSTVSGLDYDYATAWSNGWMDLAANFIPGVVGGGGLEYWGPNSEGTAGPAYYGAIICFLFLLGAIVVRGPTKWWLVGGVALISLISMGKNFFLHGALWDIMPLFNKFRTPNSALSVVAFLVPVLAILGVNEILKKDFDKTKAIQALYIAGGVMLGLCLVFALMGGSLFDFTGANDAAYAQRAPNINFSQIKSVRAAMLSDDSWRSFGLILVAAGLIWAFLKDKISSTILISVLGLLIVGDLWTVNKEYLNDDNFVKASVYKNETDPRAVDNNILKDTDPHYRVFDISSGPNGAFQSTPTTHKTSYYHKSTGGYHPAKLQRYDDLKTYHLFPEANRLLGTLQNAGTIAAVEPTLQTLKVMNMMNTKYYIVSAETAIPNRSALGNAWFVENVKTVSTANEEIESIASINPAQTAVVHQEFSDYVTGLNLQKNGTIELTDYYPDHLTYNSSATSDQLAVFSEVWYGPDKGWNAYIDGKEVEHIRVNYALRALKIPSGEHKVEFIFEPKSYNIGSTISLICSILILSALGWLVYKSINQDDVASGANSNQNATKLKSDAAIKETAGKKTVLKKKTRKKKK